MSSASFFQAGHAQKNENVQDSIYASPKSQVDFLSYPNTYMNGLKPENAFIQELECGEKFDEMDFK